MQVVVDPIPNEPPTAVAAANPTTIRQGLPVAFDSSGSTDTDGTIVSTAWDFGDGNTSTAANPSKAYALPGVYTVQLTVTDNAGGTDTDTVEHHGEPEPGADGGRLAAFGQRQGAAHGQLRLLRFLRLRRHGRRLPVELR